MKRRYLELCVLLALVTAAVSMAPLPEPTALERLQGAWGPRAALDPRPAFVFNPDGQFVFDPDGLPESGIYKLGKPDRFGSLPLDLEFSVAPTTSGSICILRFLPGDRIDIGFGKFERPTDFSDSVILTRLSQAP